ncbi:hypothetical protein [Streptomyces sp. NPDC003032]
MTSSHPSHQQFDSDQAEPRRAIPWKKRGHGKVKKCARHGTKRDSSVTLRNKCDHSFTYHLEIKRGPDRCVTVKKHNSKVADWRWPGRLVKVTNGIATGEC